MIEIKGRGWVGGQVRITPSGTGLAIWIDDDHDPELWLHVTIPAGMVINLAHGIETLRDLGTYSAEPLVLSWGESPTTLAGKLLTSPPGKFMRTFDQEFNAVWRTLAAEGLCDGIGGQQYIRIRREWLDDACQTPLVEFIKHHANSGPDAA